MSFLTDSCKFSVLTEDVLKTCTPFDCGHPDLNEFFQKDCIDYSNQLLGKSYCFLLEEKPETIVCAFTISNDSIKTNLLQSSRKNKVRKNIPHAKHFNSYPAVLIGRLGVNSEYRKQRLGVELMDFIKSWFISPNNKTGCRFVVVDSYNEEIPLKYYSQNGFEFLFSNIDKELDYTGLRSQNQLKTRLMFFDLIILSTNP